jgi:hypothetical protein
VCGPYCRAVRVDVPMSATTRTPAGGPGGLTMRATSVLCHHLRRCCFRPQRRLRNPNVSDRPCHPQYCTHDQQPQRTAHPPNPPCRYLHSHPKLRRVRYVVTFPTSMTSSDKPSRPSQPRTSPAVLPFPPRLPCLRNPGTSAALSPCHRVASSSRRYPSRADIWSAVLTRCGASRSIISSTEIMDV